jgi:hypothetical protein
LFLVTLGPRLPTFVRNLACWVAKTVLGDSLFARFFSLAREKSVSEFTDLTDQRNKITAAWYEQVSVSTSRDPFSLTPPRYGTNTVSTESSHLYSPFQ